MATVITLNRYNYLSVTKCGVKLHGIISADYSLSKNINNIYKLGSADSIASYPDLADIEASITGYSNLVGGFDTSEANNFVQLEIQGVNGGVAIDFALLSSVKYNFQIEGPFTITKSYKGFGKPMAGSFSGPTDDQYTTSSRKDWSGSLPDGISNNYLQSISADITINREYINQFAKRKPYASIVSYPIIRSITYEVLASSMDSTTIKDFDTACMNPLSNKYSANFSACGVSFTIDNAHITNIQYSGGEASSGSSPQTISITYSSYDNILGLQPVLILNKNINCT